MKIRSVFPKALAPILALFLNSHLFGEQSPTPDHSRPSARFERVGPFGGSVRSLHIASGNPKTAYLGSQDGQIYKSLDGGESWELLHPGIGHRQ